MDVFFGMVHDTLVTNEGPDDKDIMNYDYESLFSDFSEEEKTRLKANHRHQMAVHVNALASLIPEHRVIHTADREFDDIFLLERCITHEHDFVIRTQGNRNVQVPDASWIPEDALTRTQTGHAPRDGWVSVNLTRLIPAVPLRPYKTLPLDKKGRVTNSSTPHRYATLHIGACRVRLYRSAKRQNRYFKPPQPVYVSVVVIRELNVPPGETPLCWVLFTTLPVDTDRQIKRVGYLYELRWKIEEYFRLLKAGYRIESFRMDNATKIGKLLIVITLAAMAITILKQRLNLPSGGYLDDNQYQKVKTAMRELDNHTIHIELRLFAFIARLGGWLGRRGDPIGPTILMRGALQVLAILEIIEKHESFLKELLNKHQRFK